MGFYLYKVSGTIVCGLPAAPGPCPGPTVTYGTLLKKFVSIFFLVSYAFYKKLQVPGWVPVDRVFMILSMCKRSENRAGKFPFVRIFVNI
jgi:hypothetical protein